MLVSSKAQFPEIFHPDGCAGLVVGRCGQSLSTPYIVISAAYLSTPLAGKEGSVLWGLLAFMLVSRVVVEGLWRGGPVYKSGQCLNKCVW